MINQASHTIQHTRTVMAQINDHLGAGPTRLMQAIKTENCVPVRYRYILIRPRSCALWSEFEHESYEPSFSLDKTKINVLYLYPLQDKFQKSCLKDNLIKLKNIQANFPASILYKSTAGGYRPVSYPDITARCIFIKNAYWVNPFKPEFVK